MNEAELNHSFNHGPLLELMLLDSVLINASGLLYAIRFVKRDSKYIN